MTVHYEVIEYIDENIFNSKEFDKLSTDKKVVAINNAMEDLYSYYKSYNPEKKPLPIQAIALQTIWVVDKASTRMSELGVASQSIEGMTQTFRGMDRTISPEVKKILRQRVGRYYLPVQDTFRHMASGRND